jgi:hypothetical protein
MGNPLLFIAFFWMSPMVAWCAAPLMIAGSMLAPKRDTPPRS